jgi:hypothetical protein
MACANLRRDLPRPRLSEFSPPWLRSRAVVGRSGGRPGRRKRFRSYLNGDLPDGQDLGQQPTVGFGWRGGADGADATGEKIRAVGGTGDEGNRQEQTFALEQFDRQPGADLVVACRRQQHGLLELRFQVTGQAEVGDELEDVRRPDDREGMLAHLFQGGRAEGVTKQGEQSGDAAEHGALHLELKGNRVRNGGWIGR